MVSQRDLLKLIPEALQETNLPLPGKQSGKVRDWYDLPDGQRLIVTTDRLSAFDIILAQVPYKGQVLNQLSAWWFEKTKDIIPNHIVSVPDPNASIVRVAEPILVEVIVRGYITGVTSTALWYRYSLGEREIYGYTFPDGLQKNAALPEPIITPTTKGGATGHDERLTCAEVVEKGLLDAKTWDRVQSAALAVFERGQEIANKAGLILVDTKYELGRSENGSVVLIDEVHTPDSSRFWKADTYEARFKADEDPENFDKEFVRIAFAERGYRGDGDIPSMPADLWASASERYIKIYELLTGETFEPGRYPVEPRVIENLKKAGVIQFMSKPLVIILMGSKADMEHCTKISEACKQFGVESVLRVGSAHKTAEHALKILREYEADARPKVYITVAGRSNALSGFTDGAVSAPVIACPPPSESFGGTDIYSSLRMPSGVAPAVVLDPVNAALLAAKILGLVDESVREQVKASQRRAADKVIEDDKSIR